MKTVRGDVLLACAVLCPRGMNMRLLWMSLWVGVLLSGCTSTGMARTLDRGKVQVTAAPGLHAAQGGFVPQLELGARYGVTDRVDVGARVFGMGYLIPVAGGAGVDTRVALKRTPTLEEPGIDLTLAPALTWLRVSGNSIFGAELPLLCGINLGKGYQVVLGPRVTLPTLFAPDSRVTPLVGSSLGLAIPVSSWVRLVPEVTARVNPQELRSGAVWQTNIGVLLGGYGP